MTCTGTGLSSLGVTAGFKDLESSGHLGCVFGRVADKNFLNRPKNGYLTLIKKESLVIKKGAGRLAIVITGKTLGFAG